MYRSLYLLCSLALPVLGLAYAARADEVSEWLRGGDLMDLRVLSGRKKQCGGQPDERPPEDPRLHQP